MYEDLPFIGQVPFSVLVANKMNIPWPPPDKLNSKAWDIGYKFKMYGNLLADVKRGLGFFLDDHTGQLALLTAFFLDLPKDNPEARIPAKRLEGYSIAVLQPFGGHSYRFCTIRRSETFPFEDEEYGYSTDDVQGMVIEIVQYGPLRPRISDAFKAFTISLELKNWARINNILEWETSAYCKYGPLWGYENPKLWPWDSRIQHHDWEEDHEESIVDIVRSGMNSQKRGVYGLLLDKGGNVLGVSDKGVWNEMVVCDHWCILDVRIPDGVGDIGMQDRWKWS